MAVAVLVLGAGRGERLGQRLPKAFVSIAGQTLIERSIRALAASGEFARIQPVLGKGDFDRFKELLLRDLPSLADPVEGGAERQDSVRTGLESLPDEFDWVAVHDVARCLISTSDIRRVVQVAKANGAAILAERVRDTIKLVSDGQISSTPNREDCWAAQTPQVIRRDWLSEAIRSTTHRNRQATDDAQLIEWLGYPVQVVESSSPNPKITHPQDLVLAETLLKAREYNT